MMGRGWPVYCRHKKTVGKEDSGEGRRFMNDELFGYPYKIITIPQWCPLEDAVKSKHEIEKHIQDKLRDKRHISFTFLRYLIEVE
jgi:hypothetical protein